MAQSLSSSRFTIRISGGKAPSRLSSSSTSQVSPSKENVSPSGGDIPVPYHTSVSPQKAQASSTTSGYSTEDNGFVLAERGLNAAGLGVPISPRRPSDNWLRNPAWIDGSLNPPHFYSSEEIEAACIAAGGHLPPRDMALCEPPAQTIATAPHGPLDIPGNLPSAAAAATTGRLTSVMMFFDEVVPGATRMSKSKVKKVSDTKTDYIDFTKLSRVKVVHRFLDFHGMKDKYEASPTRGPEFKLWYSQSPGGKTGAPTISTDHDYEVLVAALNRKPASCAVGISFDLDGIAAFRTRVKRALALEDEDLMGPRGELAYGDKIPWLDLYNETQQLHGAIILRIKEEHTCQQHLGENGSAGYCYVTQGGRHIGLNMRRLSLWGAACAAGEATKYYPPNVAEFDEAQDGISSRPRGRKGPSGNSVPPHAPPTSPSAADRALTVMAAFFAAQAKAMAPAPAPTQPLERLPPSHIQLIALPLPSSATELLQFLEDLNRIKGIDIRGSQAVLEASAISPRLLEHLGLSHVMELTELLEGHALTVQLFGKEWESQ